MILQVGVKALLKNKDGRYLFVRRNPKKYPDVGPKWDIVGGRIEIGSTLIDNLKREVKEETGLHLTSPVKLVGAQDILKSDDKHVVRLTYTGEIDGEPKIDEESLEAKWMSADDIRTLKPEELDSYFKELLDNKSIIL